MTELYIDGNLVTLPKGVDFRIKQQNPILTKNGTFTLDLTLSLTERNNAIVYKHIDRLHSTPKISNRKAVLISDGHVILNGTEAIISNTNEEVKIQLLSGNSELNYFIGSDKYVSSLDLGLESDMSDEAFTAFRYGKYPDKTCTAPRIIIGSQNFNIESYDRTQGKYTYENKAIQPYLLSMVEKILSALGYDLTYNQFSEDTFVSKIFILNKDKTGYYNRVLQGWTIKQFLEAFEDLFNAVFVIDNVHKTARLLNASSPGSSGTYIIENVLDDYERTNSEDDDSSVSYNNVAYDFPSSVPFKYMCLDKDQLDAMVITEFETYESMLSAISDNQSSTRPDYGDKFDTSYNTNEIYYVKATDTYYIPEKLTFKRSGTELTWELKYPKTINSFRNYVTDEDQEPYKLTFFPCAFKPVGAYVGPETSFAESYPYLPDGNESEDETTKNAHQIIEEGAAPDFDSSKISIALCAIDDIGTFTDNVRDVAGSNGGDIIDGRGTFRFNGIYGIAQKYYRSSQNINTHTEYNIKFLMKNIPDPQARFLFNNKLFLCKELEFRVTADGIHPEITGVFYEVI